MLPILLLLLLLALPAAAQEAEPLPDTAGGVAIPTAAPVADPPAGPDIDAAADSMPVFQPAPPADAAADPLSLPPPPLSLGADEEALAEAAQAAEEEKHNRESFESAASGLLPLSAQQIREFMRRVEESQESSVAPFLGQPRAEVRVQTLSLDPGVDPPAIRLGAGYVTSITILDASGQPWPIVDVGIGGRFDVSPSERGTHVVRLSPQTRFAVGNLSVRLQGLATPVIFRLQAGAETVDMRFDARLPQLGPLAKSPLIQSASIVAGDEVMMAILDNVPPDGAERLLTRGADGRTMAWRIGQRIYLRTPLTLLSPAWQASVSSADGMTVFDIPDTPVLLLSDQGALVRIRLGEKQDDQ